MFCCRASPVLGACLKRKRQASWGTAVALWQGADRASMGAAAATKAPPVGGPGLVGCGGMGNLGRALASKCKKLHQLSQWKQQLKPTGPTSCGLANQNTRPRSACPNTASRQTANGKRQSGQLSSDLKSNLALGPGPQETAGTCLARFRIIFLFSLSTHRGIRSTESPSSLILLADRRFTSHSETWSGARWSWSRSLSSAGPIRERAPTSNRQRPSPSLRLSPSPTPNPTPPGPIPSLPPCDA